VSNSFNWPLYSSVGILFRLIYGSPNDVLTIVQVIQRRLHSCSRDSVVGLITLRGECPMNRGSNTGTGNRFMPSPKRPDRHWDLATYPASLPSEEWV